jgi:riboflavin synthase
MNGMLLIAMPFVKYGGDMFTGIVESLGKILEIIRGANSCRLKIESHFNDFKEGESIAIDGACVTVVSFDGFIFECDISPETLKLTNAGHYQVGSIINLERALQVNARIGGHFVLGHVDKVCVLTSRLRANEFIIMTFSGLQAEDLPFVMKKGSVTINGVSLTINKIFQDSFQVMVIPHTLAKTNLGNLAIGSRVNIEFDWLARIILRQIQLGNLNIAELANIQMER